MNAVSNGVTPITAAFHLKSFYTQRVYLANAGLEGPWSGKL
jgi:hypothetical protein